MNRRQQENGHPRARPSRARAVAAATREQGGPQSRAQGPPCQFAAAWVWPTPPVNAAKQDGGNDTASTALPSLAALQDNATHIAKGNPQFPRRCPGNRKHTRRTRPVLASTPDGGHRPVCRFLLPLSGFATLLGSSWAALGAGTLLSQARSLGRRGPASFVAQRDPVAQSGAAGLWPRARGCAGCGEQRGASSKAQNCIGRQQGSLFPAPLHSTVWATTKNWTLQRRK